MPTISLIYQKSTPELENLIKIINKGSVQPQTHKLQKKRRL
jgi:hypothetical protein